VSAGRLLECPLCESLFRQIIPVAMRDAQGNEKTLQVLHNHCPWDGTALRPLEGRELTEEKYHLEKFLGGGGFACVYMAKESGPHGRVRKAVKVFLPDVHEIRQSYVLDDAPRMAYFPGTRAQAESLLEEARRMADLPADRCTNLPRVDIPWDRPWPHFAMEYLQGEPLSAILQKKRSLSWDEARPYLRGIIQGLRAIYEVGEDNFHGDLKPNNVLVLSGKVDREEDRIKLLDFGLSAIMRREVDAKASTVSTRRGSETAGSSGIAIPSSPPLGGTPAYMAPEAFERTEQRGRASDFYAFGAMLHEMLTGEPPFRVPPGPGALEAWSQVHRSQPPPPLRVGPRRVRRLYRRCLEKDPEKRPSDTREILRALRDPLTKKQKIVRAVACAAFIIALGAAYPLSLLLRPQRLTLKAVVTIPYVEREESKAFAFWTKPNAKAQFEIQPLGRDSYVLEDREAPVRVREICRYLLDRGGTIQARSDREKGAELSVQPAGGVEPGGPIGGSKTFAIAFPNLERPPEGTFHVIQYALEGDCVSESASLKRGTVNYTLWWICDVHDPRIREIEVAPKDSSLLIRKSIPSPGTSVSVPCIPDEVALRIIGDDVEIAALAEPADDFLEMIRRPRAEDRPAFIRSHLKLSFGDRVTSVPADPRAASDWTYTVAEPARDAEMVGGDAVLDIVLRDDARREARTALKLAGTRIWEEELPAPTSQPAGALYEDCDFELPREVRVDRLTALRDGVALSEDLKWSASSREPADPKRRHTVRLPLDAAKREQEFRVLLWSDVVGAKPYKLPPMTSTFLSPPRIKLLDLQRDDLTGTYYAGNSTIDLAFAAEFSDGTTRIHRFDHLDAEKTSIRILGREDRHPSMERIERDDATFVLRAIAVSQSPTEAGQVAIEIEAVNKREQSSEPTRLAVAYFPEKLEPVVTVVGGGESPPSVRLQADGSLNAFNFDSAALIIEADDGRPIKKPEVSIEGRRVNSAIRDGTQWSFRCPPTAPNALPQDHPCSISVGVEDFAGRKPPVSLIRAIRDTVKPRLEPEKPQEIDARVLPIRARDEGAGIEKVEVLGVRDTETQAELKEGKDFTRRDTKSEDRIRELEIEILRSDLFVKSGDTISIRVNAADRAGNETGECTIAYSRMVKYRREYTWRGIVWLKQTREELSPSPYLSKYEISNAQYYDLFFKDLEGEPKESSRPKSWGKEDRPPSGKERHPVYGISVEAAKAFAKRVGADIPSRETWKSLWPGKIQDDCLASYRGRAKDGDRIALLEHDKNPPHLQWADTFYHVLGNVPEIVLDEEDGRYWYVGGGSEFAHPKDIDGWSEEGIPIDPADLRVRYPFGIRLLKSVADPNDEFVRQATGGR